MKKTLALAALVAGGFAVWSSRHADPQRTADTSSPAADTTPPSSDQTPSASAPSTAAAAPAEPPAAASATSGSEITTVRPVWLRVIADGERVVERELPAGTRIPFEAQKTIVIRTGDAGAVRLTIRGEDQGTLGRDGQVVTRSFTVPAGTPR